MAGTFFALLIKDQQLHVASHHQCLTMGIFQRLRIFKGNDSILAGFKERLLATLRHPTDVECSHGQLRSRLANGLRCDNTHRFTDIDNRTTCQVATIAH